MVINIPRIKLPLGGRLRRLWILGSGLLVILVVYGELGWALVVFATAGVTDAFDGLIARSTGQRA